MSWIAPIFDRTTADISNRTARAFLNVADIRRIEGNIAWLTNELQRFGVSVPTTSITGWTVNDVPTTADIQRIRANIDLLAARYYRPVGFRNMAGISLTNLNFTSVNMIEENLFLLRRLLDGMITSFRQASFKSGQRLFLPQRRI